MSEYEWYAVNPDYIYVERFFYTLYNLSLYRLENRYDVISLYNNYHKPFLEDKKLLNKLKKFLTPS